MSNISFSKKILKNLLLPILICIVAVVFAFAFGFNKGMDYKGGIYVSVMAGDNVDLTLSEDYNEFKQRVDDSLSLSNVKGSVYTTELDSTTQNYILVVKIEHDNSLENTNALVETINGDLVANFYSTLPAEEIQNRHLIIVSTFENGVSGWTILSSVLATLVAVILVAVYVSLRMGLNAGIISMIFGISSPILSFAVIMLTRVKIYSATLAVIPFSAVISLILAFLFMRRARRMFKSNEKYERMTNYELADDAIRHDFKRTLIILASGFVALLCFAFANVNNSMLFISLSFAEALISIFYLNLLVLPAVFAMTFARKFKKEKIKLQKEESHLSEQEVLTETNLDELVSN